MFFKNAENGNVLGFDTATTTHLYSGQQYLRARYYDPNTGRYNRLDPFFGNLEDPQSLHSHADPVNLVDPTGWWGGYAAPFSVSWVGNFWSANWNHNPLLLFISLPINYLFGPSVNRG